MHQQNRGNNVPAGTAPNPKAMGADSDITLDILLNQIAFIRTLTGAETADDLVRRVTAVLKDFGFSDFSLVRQSYNPACGLLLTTLPQELLDAYSNRRLGQHDLALDYLKAGNREPLYHSQMIRVIEQSPLRTYSFLQNLAIRELYREFRFYDQYLIPVQTLRGTRDGEENLIFTVLTEGQRQEEFQRQTHKRRPILRLLADAVVHLYDNKFNRRHTRHPLNPKPLRLLTTMAKHDLTLTQAASRLCISIDTANKHMAMAKKVLGTRSQANAVYLALKQGLIDFS